MKIVKIVIPILKSCLVIIESFKSRILCFELNAVEKYTVLERVFEAVREKSYFHLVAVLFKKKKKRTKDARTKTGNFVYIAAITQQKHDKYSLQTKGQKPRDKEIFERHVQL